MVVYGVYGYAKGLIPSDDVKAQRNAIRAYAQEHGLKVNRWCDQTMWWGRRQNAGDVIIAARFGDLFASPADALSVVAGLERRGVALHVVDIGSDMASISKLFTVMATAFVEGTSNEHRRRVRNGMAYAKNLGRYTGGTAPFGFRRGDDGQLVRHEGEQDAIEEIIAMRATRTPLRNIAAAMVAKGHKISHEGVARVLRARQARRPG